jgi:hypothetical protein
MSLDDCRAHCVDKMLNVLGLFVLATDCLHCLLAHCLANPHLEMLLCDIALPPCRLALVMDHNAAAVMAAWPHNFQILMGAV